jgi:hypothetical protein
MLSSKKFAGTNIFWGPKSLMRIDEHAALAFLGRNTVELTGKI